METAPTGFAAHVAAERAIRAPLEAAAKAEAIERRRYSTDVQKLNSGAQSEIWGTHGRTDGLLDTQTGEPLAEPMKGMIGELDEARLTGDSTALGKAKKIEADVKQLQEGENLELTQAKLVMDIRGERDAQQKKIFQQYMKNGMTAAEAQEALEKRQQANRWAEKDDELIRKVRDEGIFSRDEYDNVTGAAPASDDDPTAVLPTNDMENMQTIAAWENAQMDTDNARTEYARVSAGRGARWFRIGREFSTGAVAEARQRYEENKAELVRRERDVALGAGATPEQLEARAIPAALGEVERLRNTLIAQRMLASGRWKVERGVHASTGESYSELVKVGRFESVKESVKGTFSKWWGEKADDKIFSTQNLKTYLKRTGVVAGTAGVAGAAAAGSILFPPAAGAIGGAFLAWQGAPRIMDSIPRHNGRTVRNATKLGEEIESAAIMAQLAAHDGNVALPDDLDPIVHDLVDMQTEAEIPKSRRRAIIRLGATAVGGVAGGAGGIALS